MPNEVTKPIPEVTLSDFDGRVADRFVAMIANGTEQLKLSKEDIDWGARMMWTLGQVAPIASAAQHEAYAQQLAGILAKAGAPMSRDVFGAFIRTQEGALAAALMTRISDWTSAGH